MTVEQLYQAMKDEIDNGNGDKEVMFTYPSGDYWKTQVCENVENVEMAPVKWSDYHDKFRAVPSAEVENEDENDEGEISYPIILS